MPIVNVLAIACAWCGTERGVFRCHGCVKPTCRECQVQVGEDGSCEHKPYVAPEVQGWSTDAYASILLSDGWIWALFHTANGYSLRQAHVVNAALQGSRYGHFDCDTPLLGNTRCNMPTEDLKLHRTYKSCAQANACPKCWELVCRS